MTPTRVELPKLGNTVEECLITRWVRGRGDAVKAGDVIAEIETDKTTFEITAPVDGIVLQTYFAEGALVPVFATLCAIGERGEAVEAGTRDSGVGIRELESEPATTPHAATDLAAPPKNRTPNPEAQIPSAAAYSPRASRFLSERSFEPALITGSGPGGRVLEKDVRQAYKSRAAACLPRIPNPEPRIPSASVRATIARRMRESLATTAQYTLHASADAKSLLAVRARMKADARTAEVTINHLVSFCTIKALAGSDLNAEYRDGRIVTHDAVHLAFACDTPRGLVAPVVRDAQALTVIELAARMNELTAEAVQATIGPQHLSGATFTISNLGSFGVESFTPIINPPQVAILGVGAIRADGRIGLSLTCDHQAIDGAPGARFLQRVKETIESVESLCRSQSS